MENLRQSLLEHIADWLDEDNTILDMYFLGIKDNENLHLKMAEAAFNIFEHETKK